MLNAENLKMTNSSFLLSKHIQSSGKDRWERENFRRISLYCNDKKEPGAANGRLASILEGDELSDMLGGRWRGVHKSELTRSRKRKETGEFMRLH